MAYQILTNFLMFQIIPADFSYDPKISTNNKVMFVFRVKSSSFIIGFKKALLNDFAIGIRQVIFGNRGLF